MNISDAVKILIKTKDYQKFVLTFAKQKYDEKFPDYPKDGWRSFDSFKIINENTIEISYKFGAGDYEYGDSFQVDITDEIRNDKIKEVLK